MRTIDTTKEIWPGEVGWPQERDTQTLYYPDTRRDVCIVNHYCTGDYHNITLFWKNKGKLMKKQLLEAHCLYGTEIKDIREELEEIVVEVLGKVSGTPRNDI